MVNNKSNGNRDRPLALNNDGDRESCVCVKMMTNDDGGVYADVDECVEQQIDCGPDRRCFNRRGDFQCVDTPCPDNYRRDPLTGYVSPVAV